MTKNINITAFHQKDNYCFVIKLILQRAPLVRTWDNQDLFTHLDYKVCFPGWNFLESKKKTNISIFNLPLN